jgi:hypothetical protein
VAVSAVGSHAEVVVTCTDVAPGVIRFEWSAGTDRGDGLLVDADIASSRWCAVADVLVRSFCAHPENRAMVLTQVVERYRATLSGHGGHDVVSEAARERMRSARGSSSTTA